MESLANHKVLENVTSVTTPPFHPTERWVPELKRSAEKVQRLVQYQPSTPAFPSLQIAAIPSFKGLNIALSLTCKTPSFQEQAAEVHLYPIISDTLRVSKILDVCSLPLNNPM